MTISLYDRLGGYDALAVLATQVVARAQNHNDLARFWINRNEDTNARDMALAHKGMGITPADWGSFVDIVVTVAGEMGVGEPEGEEVMGFLDTSKDDIVAA